eukprot:s4399_g2.t1
MNSKHPHRQRCQVHCPAYILRYDSPDIIENSIIDCHRQARYLSFQQQFGELQPHEQLREDLAASGFGRLMVVTCCSS